MIKATFAIRLSVAVCVAFAYCLTATAQTNTFTYQGKLSEGSSAPSGTFEMRFKVFDAVTGGNQLPQPTPVTLEFLVSTSNPVTVADGIFKVNLDFGPGVFTGGGRWLEMELRKTTDPGFTLLTPRQQLTSSPYSIRTLSSGAADSLSSNCSSCVTDAHVSDTITVGPSGSVNDAALPATVVRTTGATMTGTLDMGENVITNIGATGTGFSPSGGLTLGGNLFANGATLTDTLSMNNNVILNIGNAGTDFTSGGGLTLAGPLTANGSVSFPANSITDAMVSNTLTASDLVAGSSVVSNAEVDDNLTINGGTINNTIIGASTPAAGTFSSLMATNPIAGSITGNAATATALQAARNINGTPFNGTSDITVPAAASTLTGTTLNPTVTGSSLTSVGTLTGLTTSGPINANGGINLVNGNLIGTGASPSIIFSEFNVNGATGNVIIGGNLTTGGRVILVANAQSVTATTTIQPDSAHIELTFGGSPTLASTPTIADGTKGQFIYLRTHDAVFGAVTFRDQDAFAGTNLQLGASTRTVGENDLLVLMFNGADWIEVSYANN